MTYAVIEGSPCQKKELDRRHIPQLFRALTISYELVLFLFHFMTFEGTPCPKKDTLIWKIYISKAYSLPEKGTKLNSKAHSLPEKGTQPIFSPAAPAEAMPKFLFFIFSYTFHHPVTE